MGRVSTEVVAVVGRGEEDGKGRGEDSRQDTM